MDSSGSQMLHSARALQCTRPLYPQTCRTKDIDKEFHRRFAKRFSGWQEAVKSASEVLIDEMRTLLECSAQCESVCI